MLTLRSPFRFLDLPGEIREMIYTYLAASYYTPETSKTKFTFRDHDYPHDTHISETENQNSIMQPGLFRTCSQIYRESRLFFYRHHTFKLHIWQAEDKTLPDQLAAWFFCKSRLERAAQWLDAIGAEAREQIRSFEIDVHMDDAQPFSARTAYGRFMDDLHARLSDEATVVYRPGPRCHNAAVLWDLGKIFYDRDPARVPRFEHPRWSVEGGNGSVWAVPKHRFYPQYYSSTKYRVARPSLTFGPGQGFFGELLKSQSSPGANPMYSANYLTSRVTSRRRLGTNHFQHSPITDLPYLGQKI